MDDHQSRGKSKKRQWFESRYDQTTPETRSLCKFFSTTGSCRKGINCPFFHDQNVRQTVNQPCRFLFQAPFRCTKGDDCHFCHDLSRFSCPHRFGARHGSCLPFCKFDHTPIQNEEDRMLFVRTYHSFLKDLGDGIADIWKFYLPEPNEKAALQAEIRHNTNNFFYIKPEDRSLLS
jgi:hypothetical protein